MGNKSTTPESGRQPWVMPTGDKLPQKDGNPTDDERRFTHGLIFDTFEILQRYGYRLPDGPASIRATGRAVSALLRLVEVFEGKDGGDV